MYTTPESSLPYTTRTKQVLQLAEEAAAELEHPYIGTEHVLLGILAERKNIAAQILNHLGVTSERFLEELERLQRPAG